MSSSGTTRRVRRALALPLAAIVLAAGATAVLARPEDGSSGSATTGGTPVDGFAITSAVFSTPSGPYPAESCSGGPALLSPGDVRCVVFTIHNAQPTPITVSSISSALGSASAGLPAECIGPNLVLPSFLGAVDVPANGTATTVGVPVQLKDSGTNQDACKSVTYDFVYTGTSVSAGPSNASTSTVLRSTPNPSANGSRVTLTATVAADSSAVVPDGNVRFYVRTLFTAPRLLGTAALGADGTAHLSESTLPVGDDVVYAAYDGNPSFGASMSVGVIHTVVAPPALCLGPFSTLLVADPAPASISGTRGNDYIRSSSGTVPVNGRDGNDCLWTGNGRQTLTGGNGDDVILSGNGNKTVDAGSGNNRVVLGRGTSRVYAGSGSDIVSLGTGTGSVLRLGNGNDTVALGASSRTTVILGNGRNTVRITSRGSYNTIRSGTGITVVWFGTGTHNVFIGAKKGNVCHVPKPPRTWHGTAAAYYKDRFVNCRVVSP